MRLCEHLGQRYKGCAMSLLELSQFEKAKLIQHKRGDFSKSLQVEMIRARRYDRNLCLSIIGVSLDAQAPSEFWKIQRPIIFNAIVQGAINTLRIPDFFGKVASEYFAVALPETPVNASAVAIERILESDAVRDATRRTRGSIRKIVFETTAMTARDQTAADYISRAIETLEAAHDRSD